MATIYSSRHSKPLGGGRHSFGGAGLNLPVGDLKGEVELASVFDDFQLITDTRNMATATVNANSISGYGWTITQVTGAAAGSAVFTNDPASAGHWEDTLTLDCGTANDQGGNLQLINLGVVPNANHFPHIWIPDSGVATALDHTVFTFACRVGFTVAAGSVFDGKMFIGYADTGDVAVMTPTTGVIAVPSTGPLFGFHINADPFVTPNISLIGQRIAATALAEGVNFTNMISGVDSFETGLTATVPTWFDLALRMSITNMSDNASNGAMRGYFRRVPVAGGLFETANREAPGLRETQAGESGAVKVEEWREHNVVLQNQTPNSAAIMVPTIEVINGPAQDSDFFVDWWSMGISRFSRRGS